MRSLKFLIRARACRRRGTTLVEVVAAGAILGALLIVCAQMLSRTAVQQHAIANRHTALRMASNAMERARSVPWAHLDAAAMQPIAQAVAGQDRLKSGRVDVTVDPPLSPLGARRIRVTVTWKEESDGVERSQQLTAWRFADAPPEQNAAAPADSAGSEEQK